MKKRKFSYLLKEYFSFSSSDRNGILVLIALILVVMVLSFFTSFFYANRPGIDITGFENDINRMEQSFDSIQVYKPDKKYQRDTSRLARNVARTAVVKKAELNSADSATLESLPGIGPVFARRILKYREILGGYFAIGQVNEVYGITPELFGKIKNYLTIDTSVIKKIYLNSDDFKKVNAHPYISFDQTKLIFKLRNHHRNTGIEQLSDQKIFTEEEIARLKPYISFD